MILLQNLSEEVTMLQPLGLFDVTRGHLTRAPKCPGALSGVCEPGQPDFPAGGPGRAGRAADGLARAGVP